MTRVTERSVTPGALDADELVSMNLWGFRPTAWAFLEQATAAPDAEVLLPAVVDTMVQAGETFTVLPTEERCLSLTHAGDLPIVQQALR